MSIFGALFSAVSGLSANSQSLGMIADNISNSNTPAYKETSARFSTLVTQSPSETTYTPGGVRSQPFTAISAQGLLQGTSSPTDLAIQGGGFFVVNNTANSQSPSGAFTFTRAGSTRSERACAWWRHRRCCRRGSSASASRSPATCARAFPAPTS